MYRAIDGKIRMTGIDAAEQYPDSYILVRWDSMDCKSGEVLFIADTMSELRSLVDKRDGRYYGILEGINLQRSWGGIVVGG